MNNEKDIIEKLKVKISTDQFRKEARKNSYIKRKILATACACLLIFSGVGIATNVDRKIKNRGLGEGVQTAIENGYIAETNTKFINADKGNVGITLGSFLMDDVNLSINIAINFENINEEIDIQNVYEIELKDLIVSDEENRILYGGRNEKRFNNYCAENNLNYKFGETNENYLGSGVACFIESKTDNDICLLYNMYCDKLPKSKKLYFSLNEITMKTNKKEFVIKGNWQAFVDVPEEMYNRTEEYYEVTSCDNDDFEVYTAKVTNTGFEIGIIISNIETPKYDSEKLRKMRNFESRLFGWQNFI